MRQREHVCKHTHVRFRHHLWAKLPQTATSPQGGALELNGSEQRVAPRSCASGPYPAATDRPPGRASTGSASAAS